VCEGWSWIFFWLSSFGLSWFFNSLTFKSSFIFLAWQLLIIIVLV
jgi:hypothetical protein